VNLLTRLLRRDSNEIARYSWDQYQNDISLAFQGQRYLLSGSPTGWAKTEDLEHSFTSYISGLYKSNGIVFAIILARMLLFTEARFCWFEINDNGEDGRPKGRAGLEVLEKPWPNCGTGELLARMEQDVSLGGNFYAVRDGNRLRRLRPDWVTIVLTAPPAESTYSDVAGYWYHPGRTYANAEPSPGDDVFLPDEVCHWSPLPDPDAQYRGMSWLAPVVREVMADKAARDHKLAFFENGATFGAIISAKESLTNAQYKEWKANFEGIHSGAANAYKSLFLASPVDTSVLSANMQQLDFKVVQGAGETRLCAAGGVPPIIVGLSEGLASATYSNYGMARRKFGDHWAHPQWKSASQALANLVDAPDDDVRLGVNTKGIAFLREDAKDLAEIQQIKASTLSTLIMAGYEPDSCQQAVEAEDLSLLKHTGLTSVQLVPPGTSDEDGDGVDDAEGEYDALLDEFRAHLADEDEIQRDRYDVRNPAGAVGGGRFRKLSDAVVALLKDWDGDGDPLADFTQPQLKKAATQLGIDVPPRSSAPKIKASILKKLRGDAPDARPAKKAAPRRVRPQDIKLGTTLRDPETGEEAMVVAEGLHTVDIEWTANGETRRKTVRKQDIADFNDRQAPAKKATPRAPAKKASPEQRRQALADFLRQVLAEGEDDQDFDVRLGNIPSMRENIESLIGQVESGDLADHARLGKMSERDVVGQILGTWSSRMGAGREPRPLVAKISDWSERLRSLDDKRSPTGSAPRGPFDATIGGLTASVDTSPTDEPDENHVRGQIRDAEGNTVGDFRFLLDPASHTAHLDEIALGPEHQRKGFASAFERHVGQELAKQGYTRATVSAAFSGGVTWARAGYGWDSTKAAPFGDVPTRMATRLTRTDDPAEIAQLRDWLGRFGDDRSDWPTPQEIVASPHGRSILDGAAWQGERSLVGAPDPESAARQRQADIDTARKYSAVAGELSEFLDAEAGPEVTARRLRQEGRKQGIADEVEPIAGAIDSGEFDLARLRMENLLADHGITRDESGDRFIPGVHTAVGAPIRQGAPVRVVRPGFTLERDGEKIRVAKAVVEAVDEPASDSHASRRERAEKIRQDKGIPFVEGQTVQHSNRGPVTFLFPDDADPTGKTVWVRFDDGNEGMVSTHMLSAIESPDPLSSLRTLDPEAARDALDLRTVPALKDLIRQANERDGVRLPVSGRKRDLVDRLVGHLHPGDSPTEAREPVGRPRLTPAEAAQRIRRLTDVDDILEEIRDLRAADVRALAEEFNITIPVTAKSAAIRKRHIAQSLAAHNRRTRGGLDRSEMRDEDDIERADYDDEDPGEPDDEMRARAQACLDDCDEDAEEPEDGDYDMFRAAGADTNLGGERLHYWWTKGPGLRRWVNSPTPWRTLRAQLLEHMSPGMATRAASRWFIEVFGYAAGSDKHRVASGKPPRGDRIGPG
jgi:phage portal protein BeeE/GNAT superfamily N-acetyltransferase